MPGSFDVPLNTSEHQYKAELPNDRAVKATFGVFTLDGVSLPSIGDPVAEYQHVLPTQKPTHRTLNGVFEQLRLHRLRPKNLKRTQVQSKKSHQENCFLFLKF